jgi:cyclopropane-fatty-acyl-phospholipid synthase
MERLFLKALRRFITRGNLAVVMPDGSRHDLGDGVGAPLVLRINSPRAVWRMLADPSLGFAEAFMEGEIDVAEGDLLEVMRLSFVNGDYGWATGPVAGLKSMAGGILRRLQQVNTRGRSRSNVHRHYDLSGEMYRLFLDADMQYSCAYFEHDGQSLEDAQLAKKRHIAAKLAVEPGQTVLDIGSGWGGLGLYLARYLGASVIGVTLSEEQLGVARARAAESGLSSRAAFELRDYRDIAASFDRIVSVGMFEHVGVNHYAVFFKKAAALLKPDGVMLLHTIGRSGPPVATDPFIRKHIFPGGSIPSLSEIMPHVEKAGLTVTDIEFLRLHYAETLKAWRKRFLANRRTIATMLDERFCRMWELYLAGSEAAFRWGDLCVFQLQLARRKDAVAITRDYLARAEASLREIDGGTVQPERQPLGEAA